MDTKLPPHLRHQDGQLLFESVPLALLAREHGTPLFVYSRAAMLDALAAYQRGLAGRPHLICYAMKANSSLAVIQTLVRAGCGLDIVSGGELERALAAGCEPAKIIFSGVGKTRTEMRRALEVGIGCFNVESEAELEVLSEVASSMGLRAPVSIRVNPNVDAKTHPYISTGLKGNKFGIAHERTLATYQRAAALPGLRVVGIDCHIGSQITAVAPFLAAADKLLELVDALHAEGIELRHIDFGGGLGIRYRDEDPPAAQALLEALFERIDRHPRGRRYALLFEFGRAIVGNAGVLLTRVEYLKRNGERRFAIVDAAMNDLMRPALYEAHHEIVAVNERSTLAKRYDIVGPICETGDFLGFARDLAIEQGDLLALLSAGAYGMSMASNYNSRPRAAEVLIDKNEIHLIRERETLAGLMAGERLVD